MIEKLHAIFKERTKLIVIISGVVLLCLVIAIPTGLSIQKREQIKKQQALKIKEFKITQSRAKADKIKEDKRIADKKIAYEKVELARIEATRVANNQIAYEKIRVAKLNAGLTYFGAKSIASNLRTDSESFELLAYNPQFLCGHYL